MDVDEAELEHPLLVLLRVGPWPAGARRPVHHIAVPLLQCCPAHAVIDTPQGEVRILHLEVATGCEVREGLGEDGPGVFEARDEEPAVDEVEALCVVPLILNVFNFELAIGWHKGGLDGREV